MKKSTLICFLSVLVGTNSMHAQNTTRNYAAYYHLCNEALIHRVNYEWEQAIAKYEEAFAKYYPFIDDLKDLKYCYRQVGDTTMVADVWRRMILTGFTLEGTSYLISNASLKSKWTTQILPEEQAFFERVPYDSLRQAFFKQVNIEKHKYLQAIVTAECFVGFMRSYYADDENCDLIEHAGFTTNGRLFVNLLKSDYIPSRMETNFWEEEIFASALIHIALSLKGKELTEFFTLLKQHLLNGNLYPAQYASVYDRAHEGAYYGMSLEFNEELQKVVPIPPKDIQNVDARRAEFFLPPLWVWFKKLNVQFPGN
jgi:hypothetical protein